ncbi:MAG: hypothetical protein VB035_01350 [Candidatus Fimivivens sp.]|nr:hypothetical protein [Candidatus Fimivivens sp.]
MDFESFNKDYIEGVEDLIEDITSEFPEITKNQASRIIFTVHQKDQEKYRKYIEDKISNSNVYISIIFTSLITILLSNYNRYSYLNFLVMYAVVYIVSFLISVTGHCILNIIKEKNKFDKWLNRIVAIVASLFVIFALLDYIGM